MSDIANELAELLAMEHELLGAERVKRESAEETASQLAVLLVQEHAELEREREAREQAEAQAHELSTLVVGDEPHQARFVPSPRAPQPRLQRVS
jgi:hypothetical protein